LDGTCFHLKHALYVRIHQHMFTLLSQKLNLTKAINLGTYLK